MADIKSFRDLKVWQKAHELVLFIYELTKEFPKEELYCLVPQIRRAAISIASNIVEGFQRSSAKESIKFYNIADASLEESRYQLILSRDLGYISEVELKQGELLAEEVSKLLHSWIKSQRINAKLT